MSGQKAHRLSWALAGLLALNLGLKMAWCGAHELGGDEPFTVYWSLRPLSALFGMLRTENNPPLYFLIMHAWLKLVPLDPAWIRLPSALFSTLTVWPLFLLARRLGGGLAAVTVGLLFTFSQHHYAFAHEARAYSLLVLACTWAAWQLLRLSRPASGPAVRGGTAMAALVAANVLATWAHYFGWLMVGLEIFLCFAVSGLRPVRAKVLGVALLTVLCNLPLLGILGSRAADSLGHGTWLSAPTWEEPYNMVLRWCNAPVVAVLFLGLVAWGLWRHKPGGQLALPLWWALLPLLGMFLLSFLFPVYLDRYLLFASPGFYLLVALSAAGATDQQRVRLGLCTGCVLAMAATFAPWKDGAAHPSRVVAQVAAWQCPGTAVLLQPPWYGLSYAWALDKQLYTGASPVDLALKERKVHTVQAAEMPVLDSSITSVVHVDAWAALTDPEGRVLRELRHRFVQVDSAEADRKVLVRLFRNR